MIFLIKKTNKIMNNSHKLLFLFLILSLTIVACKSVDGLTKKERKELVILQRQQFVADSIAQVRRMDSLMALREIMRLDSIRIADSIAALPPPINYDTVLVASLLLDSRSSSAFLSIAVRSSSAAFCSLICCAWLFFFLILYSLLHHQENN